MPHDVLGHAPKEDVRKTRASVRAHDNEIDVEV